MIGRHFSGNQQEKEENQVSKENSVIVNTTSTRPEPPNLSPEIILGNRELLKNNLVSDQFGNLSENCEIIVGIPTIFREKESYLLDTLESLLEEISQSEIPIGWVDNQRKHNRSKLAVKN